VAWREYLDPALELWSVTLPGRERRFAEPPLRSLTELVESLTPAIARLDGPMAFFGHSMGGLLAYETARLLARRGRPGPNHLIVSGCPAPQLGLATDAHRLDNESLCDWTLGLGGVPEDRYELRDLIAEMIPTLRADLTACNEYRHVPGPPLDIPITAFSGDADAVASDERTAPWSTLTTGAFTQHRFPGGHFYLDEHLPAVTQSVTEWLLDLPLSHPARTD
jgi:surfactin synthase thioesterase subunit